MQRFLSTVTNRLDAKGRVSVPAGIRQVLAPENLQGFYCLPSLSGPVIEAFGGDLLALMEARFAKMDPLFDEGYDDEAHAVLGRLQFVKYDEEGRASLPADLCQHAGITDRVSFVGLGAKFQMWEPSRFEEASKLRIERAKQRRLAGGAA